MHRVFLPQLGQTMEEGTIERWHKDEGDEVAKGDVLYELTTDKATLEVESMARGVVRKILVEEGETVPVNQLVAVIADPDEDLPDDLLEAPTREAPAVAAVAQETTQAPAEPSPAEAAPAPSGRSFASPRARKIAEEQKVPVEAIPGSGPNGRVIERDVLDYAERLEAVPHTATARAYAHREGVSLAAVAEGVGRRVTRQDVVDAIESGEVARAVAAPPAGERVPLSPMRQTIAQRMTESKQTIPHFYLVGEINMRAARDLAAEVTESTGAKVTITTVLVKAIGRALAENPAVNSRFDGDAIVRNSDCNVGVAVAVEEGLFVPVVKRADRKRLTDVAREIRSLADAARGGTLIPEQYEGGSVTLSNLGMFGVDYFQPIINPPESCIIGVGAVTDRPVVIDGGIHVEPIMKVSLSADHRVVDGVAAAEFFRSLKELLEGPAELRS